MTWQTFYAARETPGNYVYGMYDLYLSQLETGPTQAERVLYHTPMMDSAHERRFVISETESSMPDFEQDHSRRIGSYTSLLETRINDTSNHFARIYPESEDFYIPESTIVETDFLCMGAILDINLAYSPLDITERQPSSPRDNASSIMEASLTNTDENRLLEQAISVDDGESIGREFDEKLAREIIAASKISKMQPPLKTRQRKMVRSRVAPRPVKPVFESESRRRLSVGFLLTDSDSTNSS